MINWLFGGWKAFGETKAAVEQAERAEQDRITFILSAQDNIKMEKTTIKNLVYLLIALAAAITIYLIIKKK